VIEFGVQSKAEALFRHPRMLPDNTPVLALIPARGGSKGIPRKNLAMLAGRPLIDYSIQAARLSVWVDEVWVSSDDAEILGVAKNAGAIPLMRPAHHASDEASAVGVVKHFIEQLPDTLRTRNPIVVYLQPTSPLRRVEHIDAALRTMVAQQARTLLSVTECEKSPFKTFRLDDSQRLISLFDEKLSNARRQDLPVAYQPNGAIYIFSVGDFEDRGGFPSNGSVPFIMSSRDSIDIDTPDDLARVAHIIGEQNG
jgi:CMP-N,N'-diacetyllegionaminic acid synthase